MPPVDRRRFLNTSAQTGLAALAGVATLGSSPKPARGARPISANDKITLAIVGINGRGRVLGPGFAERPDCQVAYLCDVETSGYGPRSADIEKLQHKAPQTVQDFRRALDDKSVDAIVVATPDHWHALATVWGCQAGKHVYVEKPVSQSPWEGRKMVEAARKYKRVVQAGLQNRSAPYNFEAKAYIESGKLGRIHMCRVYNQKPWPNRPKVADAPTPASLDWNMWQGPAPEHNYNVNLHRYWNHFWRYSGGDIINDGIHQMDLARWLIGRDYPKAVYSTGGRFDEPGVAETPDTQVAVYDFDGLTMTFELTLYANYMIKSDMALRDTDEYPYWPQNGTRVEIYGTEGLMIAGRHGDGWQVFGRTKNRKPVIVAQGNSNFPDPEHKANFCEAIRENKLPNADIEQGHRSTLLSEYANISYRLGGQKLLIDSKTETCIGNPQANAMLKREYRSPWIVPDSV
jgi:predicted dehydrogenase